MNAFSTHAISSLDIITGCALHKYPPLLSTAGSITKGPFSDSLMNEESIDADTKMQLRILLHKMKNIIMISRMDGMMMPDVSNPKIVCVSTPPLRMVPLKNAPSQYPSNNTIRTVASPHISRMDGMMMPDVSNPKIAREDITAVLEEFFDLVQEKCTLSLYCQ